MRPNIGLQLYTVRDVSQRDFSGALQKVAEFGYEGVEFAGFGGLGAESLRSVMSGLSLAPVAAHVSLSDLENELDATMEYAKTLGLSYLVCPWLPPERRANLDDYRKTANLLANIGAKCRAAGLAFCYHNHAFEFEVQETSGSFALDVLYEEASPRDLQAELDLYWIERGGQSAAAYIRKYAGRAPLLHLKDMAADAERGFADVGSGILDIPGLLKEAETGGVQWCFVEHDAPQDSLQSAAASAAYLRSIGALEASR